jgi:hypothetical protein
VTIHKDEAVCDYEVSDGVWTNVFRGVKLDGAPDELFPVTSIWVGFAGPALQGTRVYVDDVEFVSARP